MATIDEIKQQAAAVKNATQVGENTAMRVGGALAGLADIAEQQDTEIGKKFDKESVVQESGDAEDKVMSQKAVSAKLSDLSGKVFDFNNNLISDYWLYDTGITKSTGSLMLQIPVIPGQSVEIKSNSQHDVGFGFSDKPVLLLPSLSRIINGIGDIYNSVVPSGKFYILMNIKFAPTDTVDSKPEYIKINGFDILQSITEKTNKLENEVSLNKTSIKNVEKETIYNVYDNIINYKWVADYSVIAQRHSSILRVPVKKGDVVEIKANEYRDCGYIYLNSIKDEGNRVLIKKGNIGVSTALFDNLYINLSDFPEDESCMPDYIKVNGINILNSVNNNLSYKISNPPANIMLDQYYDDITSLTWDIIGSYRNLSLWANNPFVDIDFRKQYFTRFVNVISDISTTEITINHTKNGMEFVNNTNTVQYAHFCLPCSMIVPSISEGIRVIGGTSHAVGISLIVDINNFVMIKNNSNNAKNLSLICKSNGSETLISEITSEIGDKYELHLNIGNDCASGFVTNDNEYSTFVGEDKIKMDTLNVSSFKNYRAAIYVCLQPNEKVTVERVNCGISEGFGHADFKSVTYENGEPIIKDGCFFLTSSSRMMGINGGNGVITVYKVSINGFNVEPISYLSTNISGRYENGTSSKILFDRNKKEWLYLCRHNPAAPGGSLYLGKSRTNLLSKGVHLIDIKETQLRPHSLDGDIIKIKNMWYVAYHDGANDYLTIAKSKDLKTWEEIVHQESGEGISIIKFNKKYLIIDARGINRLGVSEFNVTNETVTYIKDLVLKDNPGINGKGGNSWGCIIPYYNGWRTKYYMTLFSRDLYMNMKQPYSYGSMWFYQARENVYGESEYEQKENIEYLGY